ncbi:hypothetical protein [Paenibacillus sp. FSL P4-0288]|uniref:hypothetical protein n=1 Tax=Paenibacillus sp. FSL P4-0288 TaxID=2921633 RepID=UPI0030F4BC62
MNTKHPSTHNGNTRNRGNADKISLLNNDMLFEQIVTSITSDHREKLLSNLENGKGEIEYHVRDGQLQKRRHIDISDLLDVEDTFYAAMTRENIKMFLWLMEKKLKKKSPLDYGAIRVRFEIDTTGKFEVCECKIITESHYARF